MNSDAPSSRPIRKRKLETDDEEESDNQVAKYQRQSSAPPNARTRTMLNEIVLTKVTKHLSPVTLLILRGTCTSWSSHFVPQLKKVHGHIKLLSTGPGLKLTSAEGESKADFTDILRSSSDFPFAKFEFILGDHDDHLGLEPLYQFSLEFGSCVTNLWINFDVDADFSISQLRTIIMDGMPCLTELFFEMCGLGPRRPPSPTPTHGGDEANRRALGPKQIPLKLLKVIVGLESQEEESIVNPGFLRLTCDLIRSASKLEELNMSGGHVTVEQGDLVRHALRTVLGSAHHINMLKRLKLTHSLRLSDLQTLVQMAAGGLRLKVFHASVSCPRDAHQDWMEGRQYFQLVHEFLITQSSTLKKLSLRLEIFEPNEYKFECCIPRMEHLDELEIGDSSLQLDELQFTETRVGTLTQTFPELNTFSYISVDSEVELSGGVDLARFFHPGVTNLKVRTGLVKLDLFQKFASTFPSVTRLDLELRSSSRSCSPDDDLIDVKKFGSKLWTTWPQLTGIRIHLVTYRILDLDLDALLSGVPRVGLERLKHEFLPPSEEQELTLDSLREGTQKYKTRPGISDLKQLRELCINFESRTGGHDLAQLTDAGGYFGLALASLSLQRVVIGGFGENLVSEDCREFLRDTFGPAVEITL